MFAKLSRRASCIGLLAIMFTPITGMTPANAAAAPASPASAAVGRLSQEVERAEGLRAVKRLQNAYAQYIAAGLWSETAQLFASRGELNYGADRAVGVDAIHQYFSRTFGGGREGLPEGGLNTKMITGPVIVLAPDGETATARWNEFAMSGRYGGEANWSGGIHENRYVKEGGVWKIARLTYTPIYAGAYETGWFNLQDDTKPIPYSFTPQQAGQPLSASPIYPAPRPVAAARTSAELAALQRRISKMVDEDKVLNLQNAYGYYLDRKMWNDVVDLFTPDALIEDQPIGVYLGTSGVRRWLATMGPSGLRRGEANDHPQFGTVVTVEPNGSVAHSRGFQMTMLGDVDKGTASIGLQVLENRFVKQGGVWRIREMRILPLMNTDYYQGWNKSRLVPPAPPANARPDRPPASERVVAAFDFRHPVTGRPVGPPAAARGSNPAPIAAAVPAGSINARLAEARRGLKVALAYTASENISNAFSYWLDDFRWDLTSALFHEKGRRGKYMVGFYEGPEHVLRAETAMYGGPRSPRPGVAWHYRLQPVIDVNDAGTETKLRTRLFQIGSNRNGPPGSFSAGMYPNDRTILDNGVWKVMNVAIDEPYISSSGYKDGWARPRPPAPVDPNAPPLGTDGIFKKMTDVIKPDYPIAQFPLRQQGFIPGDLISWPDIKPMWFHYKNPVSGREPPYYCPDQHTCERDLEAKAALAASARR